MLVFFSVSFQTSGRSNKHLFSTEISFVGGSKQRANKMSGALNMVQLHHLTLG